MPTIPRKFGRPSRFLPRDPMALIWTPVRDNSSVPVTMGRWWRSTLDSGEVRLIGNLSGPPDVIFFNRALRRVYVAVGSPGVVDVFDVRRMKVLETVPTEKGAHTLAFDHRKNKVYALLPATHRAAVFQDD